MLATTDQFRDYRSVVKYLKKLRPIKAIDELPIMTTLNKVIFLISVNMISENICLLHVQALLNHIQFMYDSIDSDNFVISVFFDSKKAFDTVDHNFFCQNLIFTELEEFHMNLLNHILVKEIK